MFLCLKYDELFMFDGYYVILINPPLNIKSVIHVVSKYYGHHAMIFHVNSVDAVIN